MRYLVGLTFFLVSLLPATGFAATLYIDPGVATLFRGDAITLSVRIMPDSVSGECINTADIVLTYPESVQPVDVSIGRSIFSVWVEEPVINKGNRTITMAGGVPNGYCGRVQGDPGLTNVIADVVFRSPGLQIGATADNNLAEIGFAPETQVYLNDGQGTKAPLLMLASTLTLEKTAGAGIVDDWREAVRSDDVPPESFSIQLQRDSLTFSGKYFIIFSTSDKQTGVSHYEVMEEPLTEFGSFTWGATDAPWVRATSPYVLSDQSLNSTIRVRAYDKAGNEYIATLVPDESMRSLSRTAMYTYIGGAALGLFGLILIITLFWFIRRLRARSKVAQSGVSEDGSEGKTDDNNDLV